MCGGEDTGYLCLDEDINCTEYILDNVQYALNWAAAIGTQNWVQIVNMITGEHPDLDYPMCSTWNDGGN